MSEQQTSPSAVQEPAENGPGSQLRDERLRREMTLEEVASRLHLARATIENLERDDYAALPPMTFVRGYVRSYSVLLGFDPDPLVARLEEVRPTGEDSTLKVGPGVDSTAGRWSKSTAGLAGGRLPVMALSIALLVAVAGTAGWLLSRDDADSVVDPSDEDAVTAPPETAPTEPPLTAPEPEPEPADLESAGPSPADREPEGLPSLVQDPGDRAVEPVAEEPALGTAPAPETAEILDPPLVSEPDQTDGDPSNAMDMAATVELVFTGESWVEVTDGRGERLIFGLVADGEEQLAGEPPFEIVIGDINEVSLSYRGEAIDLDQHARGNVARFTLGDS